MKKKPKKRRYKWHGGIKCLQCGDEIYSMSRHDFKWCRGHHVYVDGGFEYMRAGGDLENYQPIRKRVYLE